MTSKYCDDLKEKYYTIGIYEICPTDCTLYIERGVVKKIYLIESEGWKALSFILDSLRVRCHKHYDNKFKIVNEDKAYFAIDFIYCSGSYDRVKVDKEKADEDTLIYYDICPKCKEGTLICRAIIGETIYSKCNKCDFEMDS